MSLRAIKFILFTFVAVGFLSCGQTPPPAFASLDDLSGEWETLAPQGSNPTDVGVMEIFPDEDSLVLHLDQGDTTRVTSIFGHPTFVGQTPSTGVLSAEIHSYQNKQRQGYNLFTVPTNQRATVVYDVEIYSQDSITLYNVTSTSAFTGPVGWSRR